MVTVHLQCITKKAWFLPFSRSLLMTYYFDNIESEKIIYCFGKSLEKVLNFGSKNLYLKARKLHIKKLHTAGSNFLCCYIPATMFRCSKEYAKNMMTPFPAWYIYGEQFDRSNCNLSIDLILKEILFR